MAVVLTEHLRNGGLVLALERWSIPDSLRQGGKDSFYLVMCLAIATVMSRLERRFAIPGLIARVGAG